MNEELCILNYHDHVFLYANKNDNFIKSLPHSQKLNNYSTKKISHTHIEFFEKFFKNLDNVIFIDVGAYVGTISILLAYYFPKSLFYLFEPNKKNFNCIKKSIELNKLKNIFATNKAVSNYCGTSNFIIDGNNEVTGRLCGTETQNKVDVTTLDKEFNLHNQNLIIKIDTEGYEPNVLKGMINLISNNNCSLIVEVHPFCIEEKINENQNFFDFLIEKFVLFSVENIGYPKSFKKINNKEDLIKSCTRNNVCDLVCVDRLKETTFIRNCN